MRAIHSVVFLHPLAQPPLPPKRHFAVDSKIRRRITYPTLLDAALVDLPSGEDIVVDSPAVLVRGHTLRGHTTLASGLHQVGVPKVGAVGAATGDDEDGSAVLGGIGDEPQA